MNELQYKSSKLEFALINWGRNNHNKKELKEELEEAYSYIEKDYDLNIDKDLPKFFHTFFPAVYIKKLALDLIDCGFPMIDLYKKYDEHLSWTRDGELSNYVKERDIEYYDKAISRAKISSVPSSFITDVDSIFTDVTKNINVYLKADVINTIFESIELDQKQNSATIKNRKTNSYS